MTPERISDERLAELCEGCKGTGLCGFGEPGFGPCPRCRGTGKAPSKADRLMEALKALVDEADIHRDEAYAERDEAREQVRQAREAFEKASHGENCAKWCSLCEATDCHSPVTKNACTCWKSAVLALLDSQPVADSPAETKENTK